MLAFLFFAFVASLFAKYVLIQLLSTSKSCLGRLSKEQLFRMWSKVSNYLLLILVSLGRAPGETNYL